VLTQPSGLSAPAAERVALFGLGSGCHFGKNRRDSKIWKKSHQPSLENGIPVDPAPSGIQKVNFEISNLA